MKESMLPMHETTDSETPASRDDVLVRVEGVSKKFCRNLKKSLWYGLKDLGGELLGRNGGRDELRPDEFWAVKDVSFELKRGECLGLIGRNGAGKTTLLRMLNGLIKPDQGRIEMRGRVGALIALGAGFNPILTGRENIYVNAAVLGLSKKETDEKFDEIVDFAELGEFIDAPVQSYSSGMQVRLGFAVAAVLVQPDVLLLDEVLAVGDIGFTIKCLNMVRRLTQRSAVVFVYHNMQYVSAFCSRVMVMNWGGVYIDAQEPAEGIDRYYSLMSTQSVQISGTGEASIHRFELHCMEDAFDQSDPIIKHGASAQINLEIHQQRTGAEVSIHLYIMDESMSPIICMPVSMNTGELVRFSEKNIQLELPLNSIDLATGKYSFVVSVNDADTRESLVRVQGLKPFRIFAERTHWGKIVRPAVHNVTNSGTVKSNAP